MVGDFSLCYDIHNAIKYNRELVKRGPRGRQVDEIAEAAERGSTKKTTMATKESIDEVVQRAKNDLKGYAHPFLVAIAHKISPF